MIKLLYFRKKTERQEDMRTLRLLRAMVEEYDSYRAYNMVTDQEYNDVMRKVLAKIVMLEEKYKDD